jgi:hypothetical protein
MSDWTMLTRPKMIPDQSRSASTPAAFGRAATGHAGGRDNSNHQSTVACAAALEEKSWI